MIVPRNRTGGLLLVASLAVTLMGCSSGEESRGSAADAQSYKPQTSKTWGGVAISLPLDPYTVTAQEREALNQAVATLAGDCMKEYGFDWPAPLPPTPRNLNSNARLYGVTDPESVAVFGYHPPLPKGMTAGQAEQESARQRAHYADVSPAAMTLYKGDGPSSVNGKNVPEGGCLGETRRKVGLGDAATLDATFTKVNLQASELAANDPRVSSLNQRWAACMKESGYHYKDPLAAAGDPEWTAGEGGQGSEDSDVAGTAKPREITVASMDVECKQRVDYVRAHSSVQSEHQNKLIETNITELSAARDTWKSALAKANELLAKRG
ncbi:hypothetical protein AB0O01_35190 [Streptomyces sp. NPDC093252]|uniref:hypothetical protein n=1 Tax=Streptomyces sp. NPDC093252 TaxID=3154980 RepID=UPI0034134759